MPEIDRTIKGAASSPGGDAAIAIRGRLNPIDTRRFRSVALWKQGIETDADGNASISMDVPEFSGELRLMVVAVAEKALGAVSASVKVKRNLVVLSSLPRFLAPGDSVVVPVTLFNETGKTQNITASVTCKGPLAVKNNHRKATLSRSDSGLFEFNLAAADKIGKGVVRIEVTDGEENYSEKVEIAVRPPTGRIADSDTGAIMPGKTAILRFPRFIPSSVKNDLVFSGHAAVQLNGALNYLMTYPYGCLEQTVSSSFM
jgi:uncharacterized protein YfaS (alpha-2-macroglobulin family)